MRVNQNYWLTIDIETHFFSKQVAEVLHKKYMKENETTEELLDVQLICIKYYLKTF